MASPTVDRYLFRGVERVPVEVAGSRSQRRRGLLGRDGIEGAFLLEAVRSIHTFGMHFTIDVALLDSANRVVHMMTVPPGRVTRPRRRARSVLEMPAESLDRWAFQVGEQLDFVAHG